MDELGGSGEEKDLLAGTMGDRGIQDKLHYQGCISCQLPRILASGTEKIPLLIPLCLTPATLKHILVGCKTSHTQGRYPWWHNQVLRCLAAVLEDRWTSINALPLSISCWPTTAFVQVGECQANLNTSRPDAGQLSRACDWKRVADIDQKLCFLLEIVSTDQRPDLVLWSTSLKHAYIIELTVPWRRPTSTRS